MQGNDLYSYTGGRWLNRDELERNSRYIQFDFSALCDRAIRACPAATKVVKYEKREGGFNRVFILTMDNGSRVVARLPTSIAGAPMLSTNSEVATMTYCKLDSHICPLKIQLQGLLIVVSYSKNQTLASNSESSGLER